MEWVASTLTPSPNVVYPALLKLMRTPRLPAVDWTDAPTDLNGLVRFGERRNLVSARVQSRSARAILQANRIEWRHGYSLVSAELSVVVDQSWRQRKYADKIYINADILQWLQEMARRVGKNTWKPNPEIALAIGREWYVSAGERGKKCERVFTPWNRDGLRALSVL